MQIGGAIGTLFCLALTLGSSLYVLGAVETIMTGFSSGGAHGGGFGIAQVFFMCMSMCTCLCVYLAHASSTLSVFVNDH